MGAQPRVERPLGPAPGELPGLSPPTRRTRTRKFWMLQCAILQPSAGALNRRSGWSSCCGRDDASPSTSWRPARIAAAARERTLLPVTSGRGAADGRRGPPPARSGRRRDPRATSPPGLPHGLAHDACPGRRQAVVLGTDIPDLQPDPHRGPRRARRASRYLQQSLAEEEHDAGVVGGPELTVNRQAQYIAVEAPAPV
jgi:hypothetical protein